MFYSRQNFIAGNSQKTCRNSWKVGATKLLRASVVGAEWLSSSYLPEEMYNDFLDGNSMHWTNAGAQTAQN